MILIMMMKIQVEEEGEEVEMMELHQGCRQIYTAETAQEKIQDELLKQRED